MKNPTVTTLQCCPAIAEAISENEFGFVYIGKYREYGLKYRDGGSSYQLINFCPWCGKKLPSSLRDKLFDQLEQQGIDLLGSNIPSCYDSDEWWIDDISVNNK